MTPPLHTLGDALLLYTLRALGVVAMGLVLWFICEMAEESKRGEQ